MDGHAPLTGRGLPVAQAQIEVRHRPVQHDRIDGADLAEPQAAVEGDDKHKGHPGWRPRKRVGEELQVSHGVGLMGGGFGFAKRRPFPWVLLAEPAPDRPFPQSADIGNMPADRCYSQASPISCRVELYELGQGQSGCLAIASMARAQPLQRSHKLAGCPAAHVAKRRPIRQPTGQEPQTGLGLRDGCRGERAVRPAKLRHRALYKSVEPIGSLPAAI